MKHKTGFLLTALFMTAFPCLHAATSATVEQAVPEDKQTSTSVSSEVMRSIYEEIKTPYKYGVVLKGSNGALVDSPSVFRHGDKWYMIYIEFRAEGYETLLAQSDDLLHWKPLGKILPFRPRQWDSCQAAGYAALQDPTWGGSYKLEPYNGYYWMSYLGGALKGYETAPLSIGVARTLDPSKPLAWERATPSAVLTPSDPDSRWFEQTCLFKSHVISDTSQSLGRRFLMYYNASTSGTERIALAGSDDMLHWKRMGNEPLIDHDKGISGDPQLARIGKLWVMFYFGATWKPGAFERFACSYDLTHWTPWHGEDLVASSEPWDRQYAHKPWVIKHNGVVYHYYCAVGDQGRVIALATSKPL